NSSITSWIFLYLYECSQETIVLNLWFISYSVSFFIKFHLPVYFSWVTWFANVLASGKSPVEPIGGTGEFSAEAGCMVGFGYQ
ncbi:MAG: hypothetical protein AB2712_07255, partial [Candidatus Thiodiazotropha sp.]